jgi:hypothetical protein
VVAREIHEQSIPVRIVELPARDEERERLAGNGCAGAIEPTGSSEGMGVLPPSSEVIITPAPGSAAGI